MFTKYHCTIFHFLAHYLQVWLTFTNTSAEDTDQVIISCHKCNILVLDRPKICYEVANGPFGIWFSDFQLGITIDQSCKKTGYIGHSACDSA